jgi:hypothetical protein
MTEQKKLSALKTQLLVLENKITDMHYFIATAPCIETKLIYQGTLAELTENLNELYKQRDQLSEKKEG